MPSLVQVADGHVYPILRKITSIGSCIDNDIVLRDDDVAETHAYVHLESGRFVLTTSSRSAILKVNGEKAKKHPLEHDDEIEIGRTFLKFKLWDEPQVSRVEPTISTVDELTAYQALAEFSQRLAERRTVDELLEALMDEAITLTGADKGFLLLLDDGELHVKTARRINRETISATLDSVSDSIIHRVLEQREPIIVSDALTDREFQQSLSVVQLRLCSVMCVPLVFQGQLLGALYVGNDNVVNLFEQRSLEILTVFASQAALLLQLAMQRQALTFDNARLRSELAGQKFGNLIGSCDAIRDVFRQVEKVAATDITVLVLGETGTGKELIARELHRRSRRADGPFIALNCGAIPENLMESELFGHRKGAFTGAIENKIGCFQAADKGTLFLDEIGDMPMALQVKLLRALQERVVLRLGDTKPQPVDIRLIAATNAVLEDEIQAGRFREDLYYRLNVIRIALPPLRDRDEDVILLARYLIDRFAKEFGRPALPLTNEALLALRKHSWPGNIRELENCIKKALVMADGDAITPEELGFEAETIDNRILPLAEAKEAFQRRYIDKILALNNGNRTKTAKDLGVDPRTIFRHLEKNRDDG